MTPTRSKTPAPPDYRRPGRSTGPFVPITTRSNAALSPRAIAAALNGCSPATVLAAQEAVADPELETQALAPAAPAAPAEAPARPLRELVRLGAGQGRVLMFRVGRELFAAELSAVEETIEPEELRAVPTVRGSLLGTMRLRDRLVPLHSPAAALGAPLAGATLALVARLGDRLVALAVDDVLDVLEVDFAQVRPAPGTTDADGFLLGVARSGAELVTLVDWDALVAACVGDRAPEGQ